METIKNECKVLQELQYNEFQSKPELLNDKNMEILFFYFISKMDIKHVIISLAFHSL